MTRVCVTKLSDPPRSQSVVAVSLDHEGYLLRSSGDEITPGSLCLLSLRDICPVRLPPGPSVDPAAVQKRTPLAACRLRNDCPARKLQPPERSSDARAWLCRDCGGIFLAAVADRDPSEDRSEGAMAPIDLSMRVDDGPLTAPNAPQLLPELGHTVYTGVEHRHYPRFGVSMPVAVVPVDGQFRIAGETAHVVTRNVSLGGVSIKYPRTISAPYLLVGIAVSEASTMQMLMAIRRMDPRFHMHFIPTSSSWLNLVERFFAELTNKRLRRGTFRSVPALVKAIRGYVEHHNDTTEGFQWKATADAILAKAARAKATLDKITSK